MSDKEFFKLKRIPHNNVVFDEVADLITPTDDEEIKELEEALNSNDKDIESNAAYYGHNKAKEVSEFFEKSYEKDKKIFEDMAKEWDELNIPEEIIPKDKEWYWVRYAVPMTNHQEVDLLNTLIYAGKGWKPVWACQHPKLHTKAKKKYSNLFIQFKDVILCERDKLKPEPEKLSFWERFKGWIKRKDLTKES